MEKTDKNGFEKVVLPELIKFNDDLKQIAGAFEKIESSKKYDESYKLIFVEGKTKKAVFINPVAKNLFDAEQLKQGDLFILEFIGMKKNLDKTQEYMDFELFVKRKKAD